MKTHMYLFIVMFILGGFTGSSDAAVAKSIDFKSDLRVRYQTEDTDSSVSRVRNRIRFRLGGASKVSDLTTVSFGLASGSDDQRSTNQTLENSFQTPDIRLDYAFVSHDFTDQITGFAGKMKSPLYRPSDMLWDSDINLDGFALTYQSSVYGADGFVTVGYLVLEELSDDVDDPYLLAIQPGVNLALNSNTTLTTAVGYYASQNLAGNTLEGNAGTNTGATTGLDDEFSVIALSSHLNIHNQFGLQLIKPFFELASNTNQDSNNDAWTVGVKFGDKKVKGFGAWQAKINYRYLQADSWMDAFPDSDAYGGATNVEGLEFALNYGLSSSTRIGVDFYSMDVISGDSDQETLVQIDLLVKI